MHTDNFRRGFLRSWKYTTILLCVSTGLTTDYAPSTASGVTWDCSPGRDPCVYPGSNGMYFTSVTPTQYIYCSFGLCSLLDCLYGTQWDQSQLACVISVQDLNISWGQLADFSLLNNFMTFTLNCFLKRAGDVRVTQKLDMR